MGVVVFTGKLTTQTRKEAAAEAESHGLTVGSSLTKATTVLVCGENVGAKKMDDARKNGVQVLTEAEWRYNLSNGIGVDGVSASAVSLSSSLPATETTTTTAAASKKRKAAEATPAPAAVDTAIASSTLGEQATVVFTGTLLTQSRKDATKAAEAKGFRVQPKMTKVTTFLVCGDRAGQKLADAKKLNVTVLTEDEWTQKLAATADDDANPPPATKKQVLDPSINSDDAVVYDELTGAVNGIAPLQLLVDGTFHDVQSASSSATYVVKRLGSTYTCSCPAWRNQRVAPTTRTCKHLKTLLGDAYEAARTMTVGSVPSSKASSSRVVKATAPMVLLAHKWDRVKHDPVGWWISEKLDGVRAYWDAATGTFRSRLGNVYPAPEWFTAGFPTDTDLDGELFGGRGKFQFTVGVAKTAGSPHWRDLVYKVFDAPTVADAAFEERMATAQQLVARADSAFIHWVDHTLCTSLTHLDDVFDAIEKVGGEGLMIRQPRSLYVDGRSTTLLKIKSFHDGEAIVIAHEAGKGKYVGMTGALRCQMASGKMFKCASGLSDDQRAAPPAIGSVVVYKCQELTNDGIPRFPIFLGLAADKTCATDPVIANAIGRE